MSKTEKSIDALISEKVNSGSCPSNIEAEEEIAANLVERELDRKIAKGRQDIQEGNSTPVNEKTTTEIVNRLAKKIILNAE